MFKSLFNQIRFLGHALRFLGSIGKEYNKKLLGHSKTIAWERGYPVNSLFFPSFLGNQYRLATVNAILGATQKCSIPTIATIAVTDRCDSRCDNCYFKLQKADRPLLTTEEFSEAFRQTVAIGTNTIGIVGGEPLLNDELPQIIRSVDPQRVNLLMFTRGSRLAERAMELKRAGLNRLYVSLDYPDAQRQDAYCHHAGLYAKALRGIEAALHAQMLVGLSITVHQDFTLADFRELVQQFEKSGVVEFIIMREMAQAHSSYHFEPDKDPLYQEATRINHDKKMKLGILYYAHFVSIYGFGGCPAGASRFYISPYGDVTPCDGIRLSFGNIKQGSLEDAWQKMVSHPQLGRTCGPCRYTVLGKQPADFSAN